MGTQACPFATADDYLLDTSHWTAAEWDAASILAETLHARNAMKEGREAVGAGSYNNQGSIRGM